MVVVDEAYIDFSVDAKSLCTLVNNYERLVVLQTFSKGFGLAGIRVGCAFANPKLIQILNNVKAPYNISKLSAKVRLRNLDSALIITYVSYQIALKALDNQNEFQRNIQQILAVHSNARNQWLSCILNQLPAFDRNDDVWLKNCED